MTAREVIGDALFRANGDERGADAILAALQASGHIVGEGEVTVPRAPTDSMLARGTQAWQANNHGEPYSREIFAIWSAMIAASQAETE